MKPVFSHDCEQCEFLGHLDAHDIYRCPQGGVQDTIVARWGNGGHEYASGPTVDLSRGDVPNTAITISLPT